MQNMSTASFTAQCVEKAGGPPPSRCTSFIPSVELTRACRIRAKLHIGADILYPDADYTILCPRMPISLFCAEITDILFM